MRTWKITTEYDYKDKVWVMKNGIPSEAIIDAVRFLQDGIAIETTYHLNIDDSDFYRFEEDLFHSEDELKEAMKIKTIKIGMHKLKEGNLIECTNSFRSVEGDDFEKDFTACIVRINHNNLICKIGVSNGRIHKSNYRLLYKEEVENNFKLHKIKTKGKIINEALRISNFEEEGESNEPD